jgi:hypothetical protein
MKNPTAGGAAGLDKTFPSRNDNRDTAPQLAPNHAEILRNPRAVREARLWLIREDLYGDLDEIRIYSSAASKLSKSKTTSTSAAHSINR